MGGCPRIYSTCQYRMSFRKKPENTRGLGTKVPTTAAGGEVTAAVRLPANQSDKVTANDAREIFTYSL